MRASVDTVLKRTLEEMPTWVRRYGEPRQGRYGYLERRRRIRRSVRAKMRERVNGTRPTAVDLPSPVEAVLSRPSLFQRIWSYIRKLLGR